MSNTSTAHMTDAPTPTQIKVTAALRARIASAVNIRAWDRGGEITSVTAAVAAAAATARAKVTSWGLTKAGLEQLVIQPLPGRRGNPDLRYVVDLTPAA